MKGKKNCVEELRRKKKVGFEKVIWNEEEWKNGRMEDWKDW